MLALEASQLLRMYQEDPEGLWLSSVQRGLLWIHSQRGKTEKGTWASCCGGQPSPGVAVVSAAWPFAPPSLNCSCSLVVFV